MKEFIVPMLAQTADKAFDHPKWVFEIKWDGYRAIADLRNQDPLLYSRNGLSFVEKFKKITDAFSDQKFPMVLDGEIVAFNAAGKPDFQLLQNIGDQPNMAVTFQVFDLLWLNGYSTEGLSLLERKELLKEALIENEVVKYCEHLPENGVEFFEQIQSMGLEGMMAKKADSTYAEGVRSSDWLKIKFQSTEDVVICGFTEPRGSRKSFGALILGRFVDGVLTYCGHTGTGFNDKKLEKLRLLFESFITKICPFRTVPETNMPPTWMIPELVCEIKFTELTKDGIFRHPVFMGLREDKIASDLSNETPKNHKNPVEDSDKIERKRESVNVMAQNKASIDQSKTKGLEKPKVRILKNESRPTSLKLTNQNKIYFPEDGITKGEMIDYYQSISEYILPHLYNRPQSLNRFPNGINGLSFYHKDAGADAPNWIETADIFSESNEKNINYLLCNNAESLAYLNNLGCIDLNPWNSRIENLENPTWLAIDLDPSDNNSFDHVIEAALCVKNILDKIKVKGYCKTSGSSGIHIYIPMGGLYDYEQVKNFAHIIMTQIQKLLPDLTTLERSLKKRSDDKIYLDYLQNRGGQTLASVYSIRPKPHAPVSMPLHWEELRYGLKPTDFNIHNAAERIKNNGDLFKGVLEESIDMLKALERMQD